MANIKINDLQFNLIDSVNVSAQELEIIIGGTKITIPGWHWFVDLRPIKPGYYYTHLWPMPWMHPQLV